MLADKVQLWFSLSRSGINYFREKVKKKIRWHKCLLLLKNSKFNKSNSLNLIIKAKAMHEKELQNDSEHFWQRTKMLFLLMKPWSTRFFRLSSFYFLPLFFFSIGEWNLGNEVPEAKRKGRYQERTQEVAVYGFQ